LTFLIVIGQFNFHLILSMTDEKSQVRNGNGFFLLLPTAPADCSCRLLLPTAPAALSVRKAGLPPLAGSNLTRC
jgi:hypothetical protein